MVVEAAFFGRFPGVVAGVSSLQVQRLRAASPGAEGIPVAPVRGIILKSAREVELMRAAGRVVYRVLA